MRTVGLDLRLLDVVVGLSFECGVLFPSVTLDHSVNNRVKGTVVHVVQREEDWVGSRGPRVESYG